MKIYSLLALCVFHPSICGTTAFVVQAPKAFAFKGRTFKTANAQSSSALSSYRENTGSSLSGPQVQGTAFRNATATAAGSMQLAKDIWESSSPIICQGGSLRTWSYQTPAVERVQVLLKTEGRPLNANVDLWQGPDNTPQKMAVYIEDGSIRPFCAVIETPRGQNTIAVRNTAQMEYPLLACVEADVEGSAGIGEVTRSLAEMSMPETIQGGALKTYSFAPSVASIQVLLKTDGRPLNSRVELLQGPNNIKQVIEVYTEDGLERPFFVILETPDVGNVVRVLNTAPMEFPLSARVEPYLVEEPSRDGGVVISEGGAPFFSS